MILINGAFINMALIALAFGLSLAFGNHPTAFIYVTAFVGWLEVYRLNLKYGE